MGEADNCHFGGHHRIGGQRHLFQRFQQHLPHPRQHPHRQGPGQRAAAGPLVGGNGGVLDRFGGDLDDRKPVGDLGQIAQHCHRVGAFGVLRRDLGQRRASVTARNQFEQVQHPASVGQPQHRPNLSGGGFARAVGDSLIEQRLRVAH